MAPPLLKNKQTKFPQSHRTGGRYSILLSLSLSVLIYKLTSESPARITFFFFFQYLFDVEILAICALK